MWFWSLESYYFQAYKEYTPYSFYEGIRVEQKASLSIPITVHSSTTSFHKYYLIYPEPGPVLGAKDTTVNMAGIVPALMCLLSWLEGGVR